MLLSGCPTCGGRGEVPIGTSTTCVRVCPTCEGGRTVYIIPTKQQAPPKEQKAR